MKTHLQSVKHPVDYPRGEYECDIVHIIAFLENLVVNLTKQISYWASGQRALKSQSTRLWWVAAIPTLNIICIYRLAAKFRYLAQG